jgi:hypothetical protein
MDVSNAKIEMGEGGKGASGNMMESMTYRDGRARI